MIAIISSCIITSPPSPLMYGGLELVEALRSRYFAEKGWEVYLFCLKGSKTSWYLRWKNVPENVYFIEENDELDFLKHENVLNSVDKIIDGSWSGLVAENYPEKSMKIWHGPYPPRMFELKDKVRHFGVSKAHADLIERTIGSCSGFIYNAVDSSEYEFCREKESYIVFLNRIDSSKGAHVFVKLCRDLGVSGVMMGEDELVEDKEYVYDLIKNLPSNVEYLGRVPHRIKVDVLKKAKCLVAPLSGHYFEVMGLYIIESGLCGTPVVGFHNGALPELIVSGISGLLVHTYEDMKDKVRKIINEEIALKPELCRKHAEKFDYRSIWSEMMR